MPAFTYNRWNIKIFKGSEIYFKRLTGLVEHSPQIAVETFAKLIQSNPQQMTDYLSVFLNMSLSVHSMYVINHLNSVCFLDFTYYRYSADRRAGRFVFLYFQMYPLPTK